MTMRSSFCETLSVVQQIEQGYRTRPLLKEVSPDDDMVHAEWDKENVHYFNVGKDALEIIFESLILCRVWKICSILDMPCGFGREARHLRAAFPGADLYACDLYANRIDFCAQKFGATPIKSKEDFDKITFPTKFDLIWCGSLLTHLTAPLFQSALRLFSRSLNPDGIAIVTLQGRHSPFIQHNMWKYLPDERFAVAEAQFRSTGFGYADYNMPRVFFAQKTYGVSLSAPSHTLKCLEEDESIRIRGYVERRWDNHQDVLAFQKTPLNL